jgi:hypothetical protein
VITKQRIQFIRAYAGFFIKTTQRGSTVLPCTEPVDHANCDNHTVPSEYSVWLLSYAILAVSAYAGYWIFKFIHLYQKVTCQSYFLDSGETERIQREDMVSSHCNFVSITRLIPPILLTSNCNI